MKSIKPTELPYFRFFHNDWMGGLISRQPREVQGFFIDLCAIYWKQQCKGDISRIKAYIPDYDQHIQRCLDIGIVEEKSGKLTIKFLKKQRADLIKRSKTNSDNVSKRKDRQGLDGNEVVTKSLRTSYEKPTFSESDSESNTEAYKGKDLGANRVHSLVSKRFGILSPNDAQAILELSNKVENFDAFESSFNTIFDSTDSKFRSAISISQKAFAESAAKPKAAKRGYYFGDPTT